MDKYFVLLTGGKNNAGDFLIKYRAQALFRHLRKDRDIVDYDAWKPLTKEQVEVINNAQALILTGGPALQYNMYPNIYKLGEDLDEIKVPVVTMGIGWKSISGDWKDSYSYPLSEATMKLLKKINESGIQSSVRDYHTLNALQHKGFKNVIMTGCPAYYSLSHISKAPVKPEQINKVAFSLGVSFIDSENMERSMKSTIQELKKYYEGKVFEVVFHHSLNPENIKNAYNAKHDKHLSKHQDFAKWLTTKNISYVDISGSAENLMNYYSNVDLHIGYRVHAHIFMNSISKPSILIAEDGRGKATFKVINGIVMDAFNEYISSYSDLDKLKIKLKVKKVDRYINNPFIAEEVINQLEYQQRNGFPVLDHSRFMIDTNYNLMKEFIYQLP